jgi:hypothetical protein
VVLNNPHDPLETVVLRSLFVLLVALGFTPIGTSAHAGLYSPDDPCPFVIHANGTAEPLSQNRFQSLYADLGAGTIPPDPKTPGTLDWYQAPDGETWRSGLAGRYSQRLAARWPKRNELSGLELSAYTADLIRLGEPLQAIQRLQPELRSQQPNYFLCANLTHANASARDWNIALVRYADWMDCNLPTALPGTTSAQLKWQVSIDQKNYGKWLRQRKEDSAKKVPIEQETPDTIFWTDNGQPIRFWESEAEALKLPVDALAVCQQLALWEPADVKLLWLVAEAYLARGQVREADAIFYQCSNARKFGGPVLFRNNAGKAREAVSKLPPPTEVPLTLPDETAVAVPIVEDKGLFGIVDPAIFLVVVGIFSALACIMITLQFRTLRNRLKRVSR